MLFLSSSLSRENVGIRGAMNPLLFAIAVVALLSAPLAVMAQVDPANYADCGGAAKGGWETSWDTGCDTDEPVAPRGPPVNCSGAWTEWGACSSAAKQWRFFEPTRWAENGGRACPQPLAAEQSCEYPGQVRSPRAVAPRRAAAGGSPPMSVGACARRGQGTSTGCPSTRAATQDE